MDDGPDTIRRIAVALSLSAGRCSAAENGGERSALRVIPGGTLSGGVAMNLRSSWARPNYRDAQEELLAVRTPFVTSQCGDKETMSRADYTQSLAAHVAATLRAGAAELLTVSHGAAGSGKSTFLFGPAVSSSYGYGYGYGESDREAPLFTSVLSRLFAAAGPSLSAAVSVVELRPSPSQRDKDEDVHAHRTNGNKQDEKKEEEKIAEGKEKEEKKIVDSDSDGGADEDVPVDVFDLLSRAVDHRTPTRSFMEDFADIPATRYVRCETAAEAIAVLHEALRHSTAWRAARETEHKPRDASNNNNNSNSNNNSDNKGNITNNIDRDSREGAEDGPMDFLYPRAGANAHILVTLLLRTRDTGAAAVSVWRLWDLSGAAVWPDDGTPAARMAFATHAALCEVAHRHRHRNALQGGWWPAAAPPAHVAEVIPLPHVLRRDPAAAMIEAALQHSSSAVLWVAALRCDACFDEVNEDALEVAAALNEISEEETNGRVIAELRRRRRQENLKAAARVLDLFATPFRTLIANGSAGEGPRPVVEGRGLREALPIGTWSATLCDDADDNDATATTATTAAPRSRSAPMRQAEPIAASPVHGPPPPPLLLSPVSPRPRLMSPPLPCGISQAFGKRASSLSPPSVADTDSPACDAEAHSKSTNTMHNDNAEGRGGEEEEEEEPEQAFSRAPSPIPFTCDKNAEDPGALAAAVRRVLAPALAEMRCATERYDTLAAELIEQHARFTARLRSLLESDVRSLSELRRRIEGLASSEFPWGEHRHRAEAHRSVWREEGSGEGIVSVFRDILQRCSEMYAEQRTAAHQAQRERDAALAELRLVQSDSTAAAVCDSAARRNGAAESPPRPLFSERTNTAHTKGPDAAELLRRVLMRATTFAVAEGDAALSIARTSDPQLLGNGGEAHRVNGARGGKSVPRGGTAAAISRRGDHVAARGSYSAE